jgi:hypothetical protein
MTLRSIRGKKSGGKLSKREIYPQESFLAIKKSMEQISPGMAESAKLDKDSGQFNISFDASNFNKTLEKRLKDLRKRGIDFDYMTVEEYNTHYETDKLGIDGRIVQKRLVLMFTPKDDLEWAHIRTIFGVGTRLTKEVSEQETINLVGED